MGSPTTSSMTTDGEPGPARMAFVYDGHCVLCSAMARHVLARDPCGRVRLVAAQSSEGYALYRRVGLPADVPTTNLFVERDGRVLTHGDSSLRILEEIGYPAVLLRAARLPRLICAAFRLPASGASVPLTVTVKRRGTDERWTRCFAGRVMTSHQSMSRDGVLMERFGPVAVAVEVAADADGLVSSPRKAWLAGMRIPVAQSPSGRGREGAEQDRYRFDVEISWLGRVVVSYAGELECTQGVGSASP